ncbi:MAG: glycosyltransferase [Pseudomonadota bacterium]|nr:glycosyltransferase [Pseudomonadota bacterium]
MAKVLLVVHYFFPDHFYGTETYTLEVARDLRRRGYDVEILSAMSPGEEGGREKLLFSYEYDGFTVHCVDFNFAPHTSFRQLYHRPEMYSFYYELLSEIAPDLMHVTHLMNHTAVILEAADACAIPVMATLTDFFGICFNSRLSDIKGELCSGPNFSGSKCLRCYMEAIGSEEMAKSFAVNQRLAENSCFRTFLALALAWLAKLPQGRKRGPLVQVRALTQRAEDLHKIYQKYRKMVAPTDFLHDAYVANRFPEEKMVKINFGINWDVVADFRTVRKYDSGRPLRFGYIGQLADHKGVDMLVRSFKAVDGNKELLLYGSPGPGSPYYEKLVEICAGDRSVIFAGTFPETELGERLSEIDVLVIPSRWHENSPLVLLYALATRTPLIVSAVKGMTEFVRDGDNGLTFERGSQADLTRVIGLIMENPALIEGFSERADYRKTISDHVDEIEHLYQEI